MPFSLIPKLILPSLTDLTPELLAARGVRFLMLDFDNTIVPYTTNEPAEAMTAWLRRHAGVGDPPLRGVEQPQAARGGVLQKVRPGLHHTREKAVPARHFRACLARFSLDPAACALAGDQIYTDVLGANCAGMTSILVSAIHNHTIWLKLRHIAELPFIAIGRRKIQHEKH